MKEDLKSIINWYGLEHQQRKLEEEVFELQEAIFDMQYTYTYDSQSFLRYHIAEELADTTVMLKQIQYFYGIEDKDVENIMLEKVQRQLDRIKKEQEGK